ncbi:hypothetical protein Sta7437_1186 [Stanieria cyanosphaera PCC 7437]|uniref:CHAT domain-containing protein n=1 Tax=Stanieria cyanosphaera (strain ATCC 29371 / PCC 7437) TaxID=111780 RepID=K9XSV9_STAC7|nr:hypothetical protein [Stanieria cyanosphaera]AFZ34757.1 hypothetical protein Sta7437_1186 [Stanieria cyanosphaera PCC 7437]
MLGSDENIVDLPTLGVTEVEQVLDWVWLIDFGQGNFEQAKNISELSLLSQWQSSTLFTRGVIHRLQGEFTRALSVFEEAFSSAQNYEEKLIIATTAYLTEWQSQAILPDGLAIANSVPTINSTWSSRVAVLQKQVNNLAVRLESNLITLIGSTLPNFRQLIINLTNNADRAELLQNIQQELTTQIELYQGLELLAIAQLLYTFLAEFLALAGQNKSGWQILANLTDVYRQSNQHLVTAWYLLCQGDLICSISPWGKPIVFGYRLVNQLNQTLDRSTLDRANAQQLYLKARQYFATAGAQRGEGMAILRLAYLNALGGQWNLASYGYQEAYECFVATGDRLNAVAAQMGKWWTSLYYQELNQTCLQEIEELIATLQQDGAIAWGLSWGLVFAHGAKEVCINEQDFEVALRLATVAETIMTVFAQQELLTCQSYQSIWQDFNHLMAGFYQQLTEMLVEEEKWAEAFSLAEIARVYSLRAAKTPRIEQSFSQQPIPWLTIEEISLRLSPGTLVIDYLVTEKYLLAWGITNEGLIQHHLLSQWRGKSIKAEIQEIKTKWLKKIATKPINSQFNSVLSRYLLQPFEQAINQAQHLVIVPSVELQWFTFETLLWQIQFLVEQKSISYLLTITQLINQTAEILPGALIVTDLNDIPSLTSGIAKIIADVYQVAFLSRKEIVAEELNTVLTSSSKLIHLFLSEPILPVTNLQTEVIVITLRQQTSSQALTTVIRQLIETRVKTIVINRYLPNEVALGMLLVFFHLNWRSGATISQSLWQAQQQLCQVTVQEALDFCQMIQNQIPWQQESDRSNRAMLVKSMGDILTIGGDYQRAVEAYQVAIAIFNDCGYIQEANLLHNQYILLQSLAQTPTIYQPERLIYNSPQYWSSYLIVGDWQLSIQ